MSNIIPVGPSPKDVAEMARLRQIMNGGANVPAVQEPIQAHYAGGNPGSQRRPMHESRQAPPAQVYMPSVGTSREEVNAMKNLLETLAALSGDEVQSGQPALEAPRAALVETSAFSAPLLQGPVGGGPYEVLISLKENAAGKETRSYNVVDANRRDVVAGLVMQEAATAIMKLLNKGKVFESAAVQEIVELEEEFNRNRIETGHHKQRYQRAMELGESAAADVFKSKFSTARATALAAQDQIKSILESIR
jgi:hypothetical protein